MSSREEIIVNCEMFRTKKALQERVRKILWSYRDGDVVDMFDTPFLLSLFLRHPNAEQKFGCGISHIMVRRNPVYTQTRSFWIVRLDGSETDISYLECLTETPHTKRFERACRVAIEPSVMKFKQLAFALSGGFIVCPLTGELLTLAGSHADHVAPKTFKALLADFVKTHNVDIAAAGVNGRGVDGIVQDTLDSAELERQWITYHDANAELRIISRTANLSHAKKATVNQ